MSKLFLNFFHVQVDHCNQFPFFLNNKRFKYSHKPSFLKPEFRNEKADSGSSGFNALAFVLTMVQKNPQWSRAEIVQLMQKTLAATQE